MIDQSDVEYEIEKFLEKEISSIINCDCYVYFSDNLRNLTINLHNYNDGFNVDIIKNVIIEYGFKYKNHSDFSHRKVVYCERY